MHKLENVNETARAIRYGYLSRYTRGWLLRFVDCCAIGELRNISEFAVRLAKPSTSKYLYLHPKCLDIEPADALNLGLTVDFLRQLPLVETSHQETAYQTRNGHSATSTQLPILYA